MAAVLALAAWAAWPRQRPEKVRVARVEMLPELKAVVNGSGEIATEDSVDIQAEIAGVIIDLPVREGDTVAKDQVILRIDPFQTESDVQSAQAAVSALEAEAAGQEFQIASCEANAARDEFLKKTAEVQLRQAQMNLARAKELYNREGKLRDANIISTDQFEVTETQWKLCQAEEEAAVARIQQLDAQIKATKANLQYAQASRDATLRRVDGAKSNLRRSEDLRGKTTIRSPISGVIVKLNVEVGERAVPGILSNPQATLMTIADLAIIEAELEIDETDIVNVKLGDTGKVVVDALPDTPLVGKVIEIGNSPIASSLGSSSGQEGKDFKVVLRIEDPPSTLRPGMSCEADITADVRHDVLVVPVQALTMREVRVDEEGRYRGPSPEDVPRPGQAEAARPSRETRKELQGVFLVGDDGRAHFCPVKTGIMGETDVEVLSGLTQGQEVIVGPLKALRTLEENAAVEIDRTKPFRRYAQRRGRSAQEEEDEEEKK